MLVQQLLNRTHSRIRAVRAALAARAWEDKNYEKQEQPQLTVQCKQGCVTVSRILHAVSRLLDDFEAVFFDYRIGQDFF